jgi:hypothetical protein
MIKKFIEDNGLDFTGSGSELNGNCVILAGFALYKGLTKYDFEEEINEHIPLTSEVENELMIVFNYAKKKNYGKAWETEDYKKKYIY